MNVNGIGKSWQVASMSTECAKMCEALPGDVATVAKRIISTQQEKNSKFHMHLFAG